ncbi:hypothetical protein AWB74_08516 [Caballeronia arvi]|uniref:Transposon Tn7 transposition protein TnsC n=1 Tax=Caballeronia arvi TaxID=1777135 RepID=A0A158L5Q2_9BURK|nr:hypothetical protein [Caballeronia arvi]SAL88339.1 hypothetical protein AWB74_08516 [Caballeronia arvi]
MSETSFSDVEDLASDSRQVLVTSVQGELLKHSPYELANASPLATIARYFNVATELPELIEVPSPDWVMKRLQNRCAPKDQSLWFAGENKKIDALAAFADGFTVMEEHVQFAIVVTAAVAEHARLKRSNPRYERLLYALPYVMNKAQALPARRNFDLLDGRSFVLRGVKHSGRSAFLRRLCAMYGPPFSVEPNLPDAPPTLWYFPTLTVKLGECRSVDDVIASMRHTFIAEIKDPTEAQKGMFRSLERQHAQHAAIAACILLNVGLFILDGADIEHLGDDFESILSFAIKLKSYGIPVLLSCTEAFHRRASLSPSRVVNALSGRVLTLRPLGPPEDLQDDLLPPDASRKVDGEDDDDEDRRVMLGEWVSFCLFFWLQGLFGERRPMPKDLPRWTYGICLGRIAWLAAGFKALHERLVFNPDIQIDEEFVTEVFVEQLAHCEDVRYALRMSQTEQRVSEHDFIRFMDHFPANAAEKFKLVQTLTVAPKTRARR